MDSENKVLPSEASDECHAAFERDFCPYKGSPDPWIVWQAAWCSSRAALQGEQPSKPKVSADEKVLRRALEDIVDMTFDPWTNGAKAGEIARVALGEIARAALTSNPATDTGAGG